MNNVKKTALGLLVAVFALGFSAFTQSTGKASNYGKQITGPSTHNWIDLGSYTRVFDLNAPLNPGEYRCLDQVTTCSATFSAPPVPNQPDPAVKVQGQLEFEPM